MFRSSFQCNRWRGQADARVRTVGKSRADPRAAHRVERRCRARFTARAESIVYILFAACERPLIVLLVRMRICLAAASRPMHERPRTVGCARLQLVLGGGGGWAGGDGDKARWSTLPAVAGGYDVSTHPGPTQVVGVGGGRYCLRGRHLAAYWAGRSTDRRRMHRSGSLCFEGLESRFVRCIGV